MSGTMYHKIHVYGPALLCVVSGIFLQHRNNTNTSEATLTNIGKRLHKSNYNP